MTNPQVQNWTVRKPVARGRVGGVGDVGQLPAARLPFARGLAGGVAGASVPQ